MVLNKILLLFEYNDFVIASAYSTYCGATCTTYKNLI
jgi:hypothetical protein